MLLKQEKKQNKNIFMDDKLRTIQQNKALHLYFTHLAQELNDAGYDMKKVIKVDIPWNPYNIKEFLWRPIQRAMFGKISTTKLTTQDINKIYDTLNRTISQRTGVHIPFPSIEYLMTEDIYNKIDKGNY